MLACLVKDNIGFGHRDPAQNAKNVILFFIFLDYHLGIINKLILCTHGASCEEADWTFV